ncbi:MAG TPA: UDP-3-O-(3-hydroxymyristoyl)glucosamine N-acyltransferase [Opitutaceae bacterium]|nr:UDP-3-O-(3-hydroxymyristoyl)glucosamine N-acyltransferase [Opitutaceae bacterium]
MRIAYSPEEIVAAVGAMRTAGATGDMIHDIAALAQAAAGDLTFLGNPKYKAVVPQTKASVVLLPPDYAGTPAPGQLYVYVNNPSVALARLCARIEQRLWPKPAAGVHPTAYVAPGAKVAASAHVGPLCVVEEGASVGEGTVLQASVFLGRNASVGADCWLMAGVNIGPDCAVGRRVRLHGGVVLGSDGFGYEFVNGRHEKVPQVGTVVVEDDVEIGANSTVDRARFGRTVIGEGTKVDNLVQIGHNCTIGKHCILCAQVGISGSTTLEDYVVLGGQVGVGGHITLGQGTKAGGQAGIAGSTPPGSYLNGTPAIPYQLERRIAVLQQKLPDLFRRVDALQEKLEKASAAS